MSVRHNSVTSRRRRSVLPRVKQNVRSVLRNGPLEKYHKRSVCVFHDAILHILGFAGLVSRAAAVGFLYVAHEFARGLFTLFVFFYAFVLFSQVPRATDTDLQKSSPFYRVTNNVYPQSDFHKIHIIFCCDDKRTK